LSTERAGSPPGAERDVSAVEAFLLRYLSEHPKRGFGAIVRAVQAECRVSRSTAAHHLARLVRLGEVTLLPNRTYVAASSGPFYSRPTIEIRRFEGMGVVRPDGTAIGISRMQFRVVAGRLEHYDVGYVAAPEKFQWECSLPTRLGRNSISESVAPATYRIDFEEPLSARNPDWQWLLIRTQMPVVFHMARSRERKGTGGASKTVTEEAEYIQVSPEGTLVRRRFAPDALLRIELALPEEYPIGPVVAHARFVADPNRIDRSEERRIQQLTRDPDGTYGLRAMRSMFVLSVPSPQLDRRYSMEWSLPTIAQRRRWLGGARRGDKAPR
jgi:hypothetical protein